MKTTLLLAAVLLVTGMISAQVKTPEKPPVKVPFAESLQAVVVVTDNWTATKGTAQLFERTGQKAKWKSAGDAFPVVVGRTGLAWAQDSAPESAAEFKKEGDGKTPAGTFPLTYVFGTAAKPEQLAFPYMMLEQGTECVDDAKSTHYNRIVDRFKVGNFDWKSSEKMLEVGDEYGLGVFAAYNSYPVLKGNGSCIFLHVWKDAETPTAGCTAMERRHLEMIVARLDTKKNPYLVQLTRDEYKKLRSSWNLPKIK